MIKWFIKCQGTLLPKFGSNSIGFNEDEALKLWWTGWNLNFHVYWYYTYWVTCLQQEECGQTIKIAIYYNNIICEKVIFWHIIWCAALFWNVLCLKVMYTTWFTYTGNAAIYELPYCCLLSFHCTELNGTSVIYAWQRNRMFLACACVLILWCMWLYVLSCVYICMCQWDVWPTGLVTIYRDWNPVQTLLLNTAYFLLTQCVCVPNWELFHFSMCPFMYVYIIVLGAVSHFVGVILMCFSLHNNNCSSKMFCLGMYRYVLWYYTYWAV